MIKSCKERLERLGPFSHTFFEYPDHIRMNFLSHLLNRQRMVRGYVLFIWTENCSDKVKKFLFIDDWGSLSLWNSSHIWNIRGMRKNRNFFFTKHSSLSIKRTQKISTTANECLWAKKKLFKKNKHTLNTQISD